MKKRCLRCGVSKTADEFYRNKNESGGLSIFCKVCNAAYSKERRQVKSNYANQLKESGECAVCGEKGCLIFHHRNAADKIMEVSKFIHRNGFSLEALQDEIAKCSLVCIKPCHRLAHKLS